MYRVIMLVIGYLLGGIQPAIIISRFKGQDIREQGSGNAGSTNAIRVYGKKIGLTVFALDLLKAIIAVIIARVVYEEHAITASLYAAIGVILGHSYPLYFGFKGGKGVAVTVGAIYFIDIRIGIIASIIFGISLYVTKIVSLSSMLLTSSVAVGLYIFYKDHEDIIEVLILGIAVAGFVIYRHRANIKRMMDGTEAKIKSKKEKPLNK